MIKHKRIWLTDDHRSRLFSQYELTVTDHLWSRIYLSLTDPLSFPLSIVEYLQRAFEYEKT